MQSGSVDGDITSWPGVKPDMIVADISMPLLNGIDACRQLHRSVHADGAKLTARQREVPHLLAEGRLMKEVADVLGVTPRTVAFHKYTIMQEHGVKTSAELVHYAVRCNLVRP
jgi:DNA-binding NarL/FixJ family response regulator